MAVGRPSSLSGVVGCGCHGSVVITYWCGGDGGGGGGGGGISGDVAVTV